VPGCLRSTETFAPRPPHLCPPCHLSQPLRDPLYGWVGCPPYGGISTVDGCTVRSDVVCCRVLLASCCTAPPLKHCTGAASSSCSLTSDCQQRAAVGVASGGVGGLAFASLAGCMRACRRGGAAQRCAAVAARRQQAVDAQMRRGEVQYGESCAVRAYCVRGGRWAQPQRSHIYTLGGESGCRHPPQERRCIPCVLNDMTLHATTSRYARHVPRGWLLPG
jgi:hypothetical protein